MRVLNTELEAVSHQAPEGSGALPACPPPPQSRSRFSLCLAHRCPIYKRANRAEEMQPGGRGDGEHRQRGAVGDEHSPLGPVNVHRCVRALCQQQALSLNVSTWRATSTTPPSQEDMDSRIHRLGPLPQPHQQKLKPSCTLPPGIDPDPV